MSENHEAHDHPQKIRYVIHMRGWLGIPFTRVFVGTSSSKQGDEVLIFREGGFTSINYARVRWIDAESMEQKEHTHS